MPAHHRSQQERPENRPKVTKSVQSSFIIFDVRPYLTSMSSEIQTQICTHLATASLAKLAQTCRIINASACRVLYLRNAREENSSAVKYAILFSAKKYDEMLARDIIYKAINYGAQLDVVHVHPTKPETYATALHMASALGYYSIVKLLLKNKANVTLLSRNLLNMVYISSGQKAQMVRTAAHCLISTPQWCPRKVEADLAKVEWLPLLVPFALGRTDIANLLLNKAPDSRLTSDFEGQGCGALTALHFISATEIEDKSFARRVLLCSADLLDENLPDDGGSALHIALRRRNKYMVQVLMKERVDLNLQTNGLGYAPIHTAISCCYSTGAPGDRKTYQNFIELLVDEGADINKATQSEGYTPLMSLIGAAEWDWKASNINIKQLADFFIAKECRLNHMAPNGETFVHILIKRIVEKKGNSSLESLLGKVIDAGANPNVPLPNNKSIARAYVIDYKGCSRLANLLVNKGARIDDGEVQDVFLEWFKNPKIQDRYKITEYHKTQISQETIDKAYLMAVKDLNEQWLENLRDKWKLVPSDPEQLVVAALRDPGRSVMEFVLSLDFNANMHRNFGSYLHYIVRQIGKADYTEEVAMQNAQALIGKGTSLLTKDNAGKTVIQRLREKDKELGQATDKFRLVLHDLKDEELGEQ